MRADLDFVTVGQRRRTPNDHAIQARPVLASEIFEDGSLLRQQQARVTARHGL
jgi:hypothetical protein